MKKPVMGIQLYTLRDLCQDAEGFDFTLKRLNEMGVRDVQISAIGDIPASVQRDILCKYDMRVCVTHKPFERITEDTDKLIEEHKIIGCDAIGIGGISAENGKTEEKMLTFIESVERVSDKFRRAGMTFNYHNHFFEFEKTDSGRTPMEIMLENSSPDFFHFIPDVAWMHFAGEDPACYLRKMKGRVKVCHFKDYSLKDGKREFCSLGKGIVNLEECYKVCCELEIPYIMYEQDDCWTDNDPLKATEESWEYMKSLV